MKRNEIKRIIREFTASLKTELERVSKQFEPEYDGLHVRALAQLIVENNAPSVQSAKREILNNGNMSL